MDAHDCIFMVLFVPLAIDPNIPYSHSQVEFVMALQVDAQFIAQTLHKHFHETMFFLEHHGQHGNCPCTAQAFAREFGNYLGILDSQPYGESSSLLEILLSRPGLSNALTVLI